MTAHTVDEPDTPPDTFVRRRWIPRQRVEWAQACDKIMREYGAVYSSNVYRERHHARWRAKSLIKLMVELDMHERWELVEHLDRREAGWGWTVEYRPRGADNAGQ